MGKRKGAVLIIVLGVLAVLALLATTFATLQATERDIAHNYLDTVRAKLLAQSGVQDAEARLKDYFPYRYFNTLKPTAPKPWKYWGVNNSETIEPKPTDKIEEATNPSFAIETKAGKPENPQDPTDDNVEPLQVRVYGKAKGMSGFHGGGSYATRGDHYVLKVSDISGRIYVNDGIDGGKDGSVTQNIRRILNILGDVIQVTALGDKLINSRPAGGYKNQQDLLKAVSYDEVMFNKFKNFVSVHAWVDPNVANPVPLSLGLSNKMGGIQPSGHRGVNYFRSTPPIFRTGSSETGVDSAGQKLSVPGQGLMAITAPADIENPAVQVFGLDTLNPQWIEMVTRAPVNINAAAEEVLIALLTDIRGFFLVDRRRNNPRWKGDLYLSFKSWNNFQPDAISEGDEYGWLMETFPIVNDSGTGSNGIAARELAREIIACRNNDVTPNFNYKARANAPWWVGPFKTWHQFNAFIDNLVRPRSEGGAEVIVDRRQSAAPLYVDWEPEVDDPTGYGQLVPSDVQWRYGTQAIADAIKANFNPNLHLNEMNPDANLHLIVDKTDLLTNSTEFCFMPTGYFEIESLGRILRPMDPRVKDVLLGDNEIVAQAKVTAIYKLYDMYRETNQKQFYEGEIVPNGGSWATNNDMSLEVGPEPDNGVFPGNLGLAGDPDNEWSGYIALPTLGGVFGDHGSAAKKKNTLMTTAQTANAQHLGAAMHAHYTLDHDAHHHMADPREIASIPAGMEDVLNHPDLLNGSVVKDMGPYNPTRGQPGFHRMARSFRQFMDQKTGTMSQPKLDPFVPSDLRIDGAYVERHSAPAYYNLKGGSGIWNFNTETQARGLVSFWWKPSFSPERTGKIRILWDMSRYHQTCGASVHVWPFALWLWPAHYITNTSENVGPEYAHNNMGKFQPASLTMGSKQWHAGGQGHSFGNMTVCLNHLDHHIADKQCFGKPSPLRAHHWINTTHSWALVGGDASGMSSKLYVNGVETYSAYNFKTMTGWSSGSGKMEFFEQHDGGSTNQVRMGGTSEIAPNAKLPNGAYRGNYSGDHTLDEFYMWKSDTGAAPHVLWRQGRYYKPTGGYKEGRFTSGTLANMIPYLPRQLPPPTAAVPPGGGIVGGGTLPATVPTIRILGMSWTWYGEQPDPTDYPGLETSSMKKYLEMSDPLKSRFVYDYANNSSFSGVPVSEIFAKVQLGIKDGGATYGPFDDDHFSAVKDTNGVTPVIQDPKAVRYFVQFLLPDAAASTVLLASPVLDDVTIFWDDTQTHLLSYVFDNRAF